MLFPKRDIFAVCFGLWQQFSKDSLYLENSYHKSSQTFGEKSLIVSSTTPFNLYAEKHIGISLLMIYQ